MNIIVGMDPGTTAAVAVMDLGGRLIAVHSERNAPHSAVVSLIERIGTPVLVASDVSPMPDAVKKIASAFSAAEFSPDSEISVEQKNSIARVYSVANAHERDAVVAAALAYDAYRPKIERARKIAESKYDEMLSAAFKEVRLSEKAQELTEAPEEAKQRKEKSEVESALRGELSKKARELFEMRQRNDELRAQLRAKGAEASSLRQRLAEKAYAPVDRDRTVMQLRDSINAKDKRLEAAEREMARADSLVESAVRGELILSLKERPGYESAGRIGRVHALREKEAETPKMKADDVAGMFEEYKKYRRES